MIGVASALVAATLCAAPVIALPASASASAMVASATDDDAAPDETVTWSVRPADASGPDGRSWVTRELDPGETVEEHLAVRNLSAVSAVFGLSAADAYFTRTGRFNMLPTSSDSVAAGTWITLPEKITVEPGETAVVPFLISVPADATPGDHAAGVAASVISEGSDDDGNQVSVESRVGFRVMTRVSGVLEPSVASPGVDAVYHTSWNPFRPGVLTIDIGAVNDGNVLFALSHETDAVGRVMPADPESVEMLPGDERTVSVEVRDVWPLFFTTGTVVLTPTVADQGDVPMTDAAPLRVEFFAWVMPWPQLAVLAALALIGTALFANRKRQKTRVEGLVSAATEAARLEALAERDAAASVRSDS